MTYAEFEAIADYLEQAAKALESAQDLATKARERKIAADIESAGSTVADIIDDLNQTSIHG